MAAALSLKTRKTSFNLLTRFLNSPNPIRQLGGATTTRWLETIAYEELRSHPDKPYTSTAVIIHGFLGSARNWRSFSRNLVATLTNSSPSSSIFTISLFLLSFLFLILQILENELLIVCRLEDGDVGYEESWKIDGEETESAS